MDPPEGCDEAVDFLLGVVEVETGAGRAGEAKFAHQRLIAVVTAAEGDAILVGESHDVVRMHPLEGEADQAAPPGPDTR